MPADPQDFAERVGTELTQLLTDRSRAELLDLPPELQFTTALDASLLCVAEVLRTPVANGASAATVAAICARQLERLLTRMPPSAA